VRILTAKDVCDCVLNCNKSYNHSRNGNRTFWLEKWIEFVSINPQKKQTVRSVNFYFNLYKSIRKVYKGKFFTKWLKALLLRCGDIHQNPGPNKKLLLGTYNVRGASDRNKIKRLLNSIAQKKGYDRLIYSFQETHLTDKRRSEIEYFWRGGFVLSPGCSNSRGVLTVFNSNLFEKVLYEFGDPNGRATWIAGENEGSNELFVSIYAPNGGANREFFDAFFNKVKDITSKYDINNIYVSGDINVDLISTKINRNNRKIKQTILRRLKELQMGIETDKSNINNYTWNHGMQFSTIDYIMISKHLSKYVKGVKTEWGMDKSDHASVELIIELDIIKGPGMFRPDTTFLDNPELATQFRNELRDLSDQINELWDPHMQLECLKMNIRTLLGVYSKKFLCKLNVDLKNARIELNKLLQAKQSLIKPGAIWPASLDIKQLDYDIDMCNLRMDKLLTERSKYLSKRARVNWLEYGERSNKYFLNIMNRNNYKSFLNEMYNPVTSKFTKENKEKLEIAYNFYSDLYSFRETKCAEYVLLDFETKELDSASFEILKSPVSSDELADALRKCGNTASGPDGIGYNVIKVIWDIYAKYLISSWNHGIRIGKLADSHRQSVICLLEKKGKDRRYVNNLRPISLSNCDIKIISKAITKKFKTILDKIIHPMQSAYITNRQVHDNLRMINIVKEYSVDSKDEPVLIGLDAKKAFDSVSHSFIEAVLYKYKMPIYFINIFKLLYNDVQSCVLVNGFMTKSFSLNRSVKQGDALSCVLFDLCMDVLLRCIDNNPDIENIKVNGLKVPKFAAYADDVAILSNIGSLQSIFDVYQQFSESSGLFLNADKTEVLNLSRITKKDKANLMYCNEKITIEFVKKIKVCGIVFSLDHEIERQENVQNKIDNMKTALGIWAKRNLSVFGRNLILKTFGLSQLIYSLQNTYFEDKDLFEINRICFQFIWKLKPDKSKAFERVSRFNMKKSKKDGGISAPDIYCINKALKVKQFLRSNDPKSSHFIVTLQNHLVGDIRLLNVCNSKCKFINSAIKYINELGIMAIEEICENKENLKINKYYYDLAASINLVTYFKIGNQNDIAVMYARNLAKSIGISNIKHFLNEHKFPRYQNFIEYISFNFNASKHLFSILSNRKKLDEDVNIMENFPIGNNKVMGIDKITTKILTNRFINGNKENNSSGDKFLRYGQHPKENEVHWLHFHGGCLSRDKLYRMKLIETNQCEMCRVKQDTDHIFKYCINAINMWGTLKSDFKIEFNDDEVRWGTHDKKKNEALMLAKRTLFLNKDKRLDKNFISKCVEDRFKDIEHIINSKISKAKVKKSRNDILKIMVY
jgi:exonuclease III